MELEGSTTLVTGASSGLGRAIALDLDAHGGRVVAVARRKERLDELAAEGERIVSVPGDVTSADDLDRIVREAGEIDVVVNNAGLAWIGGVEEMEADDVRKVVDLNVTAVMELTRRVLPGMLGRGRGQIVIIGSILGDAVLPSLTVYSATKAALRAYSEGLRREVEPRGVHVTLVTPGAVNGTEALEQGGDDDEDSVLHLAFRATGTTPENVAEAIRHAIETPGKPWTDVVAVPRVMGATRLAQVPGLGWVVDAGSKALGLGGNRRAD
jgi:NADP-dependent 3-hydroxy acid dehydrogenase YdfG